MVQITKKMLKNRLVPILAFVVMLPVLIALGFWQLDRAEQKRQLQALYDARMKGAAITIGSRLLAPTDLRFRRVTLQGLYVPEHTILLDNRVHAGLVGYFVVTPVKIRGSETRVLVNRGWIPQGKSRDSLPVVETPATIVRIDGIATIPHKKIFRLAPPPPITSQWQVLWQHMNMERFRAAVTYPVQPVVVLLDPVSKAGGFVREWKRLDAGIAVHQGYAFQWFALAVTLAAIFIFLMFGRRGQQDRSENNTTG